MTGIDAPRPTAEISAPTSQATASFRLTLVLVGVYGVAGAMLVRFAAEPGPAIPGISAFFAAGVFVTELSTGFLLFALFRNERKPSLLVLACAYLFSALMAIPYLLTFPDAILRDAAILGTRQSTAWIFMCWVGGFAFLTLISTVLEAGFRDIQLPRTGSIVSTAVLAVLATVAVIAMLAIMHPEWLPVLLGPHGWSPLDSWISYANLAMLLAGLLVILVFIRGRNELFLWLALALAAMLFGNVLSTFGGARFTLGWSASRLSWVFSGCALFLYFMGQFVRQQRLLGRSRDALEQSVAARTADLTEMVGQRDLLLREVHHRVKNNFQVVNSLINFQAAHAESDETRAALRHLHGRVYALGLVHQRLMQSSDLATFDLGAFVADLCGNVAALSSAEARRIAVRSQADPLQTDLDFAGPLGLLLTELVSAAFAHFAEGQTGEIDVSLRRGTGAELVLEVRDTATPERELMDLPSDAPPSRIVEALVKQLSGTLETSHEEGTCVRVSMAYSPA